MSLEDDAIQKKWLDTAALYGEEALAQAKKDLERANYFYNKKDLTGEEIFESGPFSMNSFVVKLNSGSLLLYAPVKIRDEVGFGDWIDSLGPVEWIVVASDSACSVPYSV